MRKLLLAISIGFVSLAMGEENEAPELSGLELYSWLEKKGMFDESVSNGTIHELILDGIHHENEEIVDYTIGAIGWYSGRAAYARLSKSNPLPDRRLQDIPGLYDFLVEMWESEFAKSGGVLPEAEFAIESALPDDYDEADFEEAMAKVKVSPSPSWIAIPFMLPNIFVQDSYIHELIWDQLYDPRDPQRLLRALHAGEYETPQAEAFRIGILKDPQSRWFDTKLAAEGLGRFQSEKGLEALVDRLKNPKSEYGLPFIDIVEAIIAYGDGAVPHAKLLRDSLDRFPIIKADEERLETAVKRLDYWESRSEAMNSFKEVDN